MERAATHDHTSELFIDDESRICHEHWCRILSSDLMFATQTPLSFDTYQAALREYMEKTDPDNPSELFGDWDIDTYIVYYVIRTANENRNSVRNNWEAMGKGLHKAEWFDRVRHLPPEERTPYHELENDTIYREGM